MHRIQVQLTEVQVRGLKELSARQNKSMAELVRKAVDGLLQASGPVDMEERKRRAIAAAGHFHSGRVDHAKEHDRYLNGAYEDADPR